MKFGHLGLSKMKVSVISRSGREVIKGGVELNDSVSFFLNLYFEKKKKDWVFVSL